MRKRLKAANAKKISRSFFRPVEIFKIVEPSPDTIKKVQTQSDAQRKYKRNSQK